MVAPIARVQATVSSGQDASPESNSPAACAPNLPTVQTAASSTSTRTRPPVSGSPERAAGPSVAR